MIKFAIRLATLAICATALMAVPLVTSAEAATSNKTARKHKRIHTNSGIGNSGAANPAPYYANPGDNPDRKVSY
jgi:hypothetical protein